MPVNFEPIEETEVHFEPIEDQPLVDVEALDGMLRRQDEPSTVRSTMEGGPPVALPDRFQTGIPEVLDTYRENLFASPLDIIPPIPTTTERKATLPEKIALGAVVPATIGPMLQGGEAAEIPVGVARRLANAALGLGKFVTSPAGVATAGAAMAGAIPAFLVSAGFTADMLYNLVQQGKQTYADWSKMSLPQKAEALTDIVTTGGMAALAGTHAVKTGRKIVADRLAKPEAEVEAAAQAFVTPEKAAMLPETAKAVAETAEKPVEAPVEQPAKVTVEDYVEPEPTEVVVRAEEFAEKPAGSPTALASKESIIEQLVSEGLTRENAEALIDGRRSIAEAVEEQLQVYRPKTGGGQLDARTIIVQERPDGGRDIGFSPEAGGLSQTPANVGTMSHSDAVQLARDNAIERLQSVLNKSGIDIWPDQKLKSQPPAAPAAEPVKGFSTKIDFETYDEPTGEWQKQSRDIVVSKSTIPGDKPWRATVFAGPKEDPVAIAHIQLDVPADLSGKQAISDLSEQLGRYTRKIDIKPVGGPDAIPIRKAEEVSLGEAPGVSEKVEPQVRQQAAPEVAAQRPATEEVLLTPTAPKAKEPWEMTASEYKQALRERTGPKGQEDVTFLGLDDASVGRAMEWFAENKRLLGKRTSKEILEDPWGHRVIIANALREGKPVPAEVLADYPDLAKPSPPAANPAKDLKGRSPERQKLLDDMAKKVREVTAEEPMLPKPADEMTAPPPTVPEGPAAGAATAPPLGPTTQPAAPTATPKALSQVVRDLAKGLGVPIQFKTIPTSKWAGFFKKKPNLIGVKRPSDILTVSHEVGHKLDSLFNLSRDRTIAAELDHLGDPRTPGSQSTWTQSKSHAYKMGEGMAEFVRHWLTDTPQSRTTAPNTYALWERALDANKDFGDTMRQARDDIFKWRNASPQARLHSQISTSNPNKTHYTISQLTRDVVDDLHFMRLAVDDAGRWGAEIAPSRNPYLLARNLRGSYGMASTFVNKGTVDFNTRAVNMGTSLEDALRPVSSRINDFQDWIVAKRAQELAARGKQHGFVQSDVDTVARQFDGDPAFQEAFAKVKAWQDSVLQYAVDAKLVSEASAAKIRDLNHDYVPFHRVYEVAAGEMPTESGAGVGRGLNVGTPSSLRTLKGSGRDVIAPLETMVKNAYVLVTAAEKNNIHTALADMANLRGMGKWIRRAAAPKEAVRVPLERIKQQLQDAGADLTGVPDDMLMTFFEPGRRAPFGENIIKVKRGENLEFYQLKPELFDTFHALDQESLHHLVKLGSQFAQVLRAGVTLTPDFAVSNAIRDTVSSSIVSRYGTWPFEHTLRGVAAMIGKPELVAEWAASGGKQSVEAAYFDRAKLQQYLRQKITGMTPAEKVGFWVKSPLAALRWFTATLEEATRIGEFERVRNKMLKMGVPEGDARRLAAFESRDYQDFAKGGAQTKSLRSLTAFWNAQLQGTVKLAQSFREAPGKTMLKGFAFITMAKLYEQYSNWDDPDYWDRPQWERDLFFLFKYGEDANGKSKFLRVPTPFEAGILFGTIPGRLLQWAKENKPDAVKSFFKDFMRLSVPNPAPQFAMTAFEAFAGPQGYSFWRGRPIVPTSLSDSPPEDRYTEQTSLTARKAGKAINLAPVKVDYLLQGTAGGLGRILVHQGIDRVISAMTGEERTARGTVPFGRFFSTPAGIQSEAVERFYRKFELLKHEKARFEKNPDEYKHNPELPLDLLPEMTRVVRWMSQQRKAARAEKDEAEKQKLYLEIAERAKLYQ